MKPKNLASIYLPGHLWRRYAQAVRDGTAVALADRDGVCRFVSRIKKLIPWHNCVLAATFKNGQNAGTGNAVYALRGRGWSPVGDQLVQDPTFDDPAFTHWDSVANYARSIQPDGAGGFCGRSVPESLSQGGFRQGNIFTGTCYRITGRVRTSAVGGLTPIIRELNGATLWTGDNTSASWQYFDVVAFAGDNSAFLELLNSAADGDRSKYLEWDNLCIQEQNTAPTDVPTYGGLGGHGTLVNGALWTADGIQCAIAGNKFFAIPAAGLNFSHAGHFHLLLRLKTPTVLTTGACLGGFHNDYETIENGGNSFLLCGGATNAAQLQLCRLSESLTLDAALSANAWHAFCASFESGVMKIRRHDGIESSGNYTDLNDLNPSRCIFGSGCDETGAPVFPSNNLISSALVVRGQLTDSQKDDLLAALP